jgi:prolyl-tRNA synthetase
VVTLVRRDSGDREELAVSELGAKVPTALDDAQQAMLAQAREFLEERLVDTTSIDDAVDAARSGFARIPMSVLRDGGEQKLAEHGVTVRCMISPDGGLPLDRDDADSIAVVGRAY